MNSRIQELAAQAKTQVSAGLGVDAWIEQYNAILGRLIIDDCVKIIYKQERIPKEFFYAKPAHVHELAIRQHFGIDQ